MATEYDKSQFNKQTLEAMRLLQGLSKADLARRIGVDQKTVLFWESEKHPDRVPSQKNQSKLAIELKCDKGDFFEALITEEIPDLRSRAVKAMLKKAFQWIGSDDLGEVREARQIFELLYPEPNVHEIHHTISQAEEQVSELLDTGDVPESRRG